MPTVPMLPPDQMQAQQASGGIGPANFLIAAADMHNNGQLSAPVPEGKPLQTGLRPKRQRKLRVLK